MHSPRLTLASLVLYGSAVLGCVLCACDAPLFVPEDAGRPMSGRIFPARPSTPDDSDRPEQQYVLREMRVGEGATAGWNIDRRCSFLPEPPEEWDVECSPTDEHVADLEGCIDDSFGLNLAAPFPALGTQLEQDVAATLRAGSHVYLIRLSGWSGDSNDPEVRVELARALYGVPSGGIRGDPVLWDGGDTFVPVEEDFDVSGQVRIRDEAAYVREEVLVAQLPPDTEILLHAGTRTLLLRLTDATLTATVSDDALLDVVLTGRWRRSDLLAELDMVGLCDGAVRGTVEFRIRDAADVHTDPRGAVGMTSPCESISITVAFDAVVGAWSDTPEPAVTRPEPCAEP